MIMKLIRKRRAVSPVIAVILLIGLTVLAGAVVSFIVLPMLDPQLTASKITVTQTENDEAYADADDIFYIEITVQNKFTSSIELTTAEIDYTRTGGADGVIEETNLGETIEAGNSRSIAIEITGVINYGGGDTAIESITFTFTSGDDSVNVVLDGTDINADLT